MIKKIIILTAVLAIPLMAANISWSEDEISDYKFAYGTLASQAEGSVTLSEFNYTKDEEELINYVINDETELDGFDSLSDLETGEDLEILYVLEGDTRIAKMISEGDMATDETIGSEMDDNGMDDSGVGADDSEDNGNQEKMEESDSDYRG